jgi:hypothetical protein
MKKIILSLLIVICGVYSYGQIDGVIVDEFTPTAAAVSADPNLSGVTTYRIFIDMTDGWNLVNVTGLPGNPLYFSTDAGFYNSGTQYIPPVAVAPTVDDPAFYDTYIAIGGGAFFGAGFLFAPLAEDATGDPNDGFVDGSGLQPGVIDATDYSLFFGTGNKSADPSDPDWNAEVTAYSGGGANTQAGTPGSNSVCIGQWSTTGSFTTEFGVSLQNPVTGEVIAYVYRSGAGAAQQQNSNLFFTNQETNVAPVASIANFVDGASTPYNIDTDFLVAVDPNNNSETNREIDYVEVTVDGGNTYSNDLPSGTYAAADGSSSYPVTIPASELTEGDHTFSARAVKVADALASDPSSPITVTATRSLSAPTASLSASPVEVFTGEDILFDVSVSDPGSAAITDVEFIVNDTTRQGGSANPNTATSYTWTANADGAAIPVEVIVTNGDNQSTTLNTTVKVISSDASYEIVSFEEDCSAGDRFCVPVKKIGDPLADVIGFEFMMTYDETKVAPTGVVSVYDNAGGANNDNTGYTVNDLGNGTMYVAIYLDANSSSSDVWSGVDENLFCVEFVKTAGFAAEDMVAFGATDIKESTIAGVSDPKVASEGTYSTTVNTIYTGVLRFWKDLQPIDGTGGAFNVTARVHSVANPDSFALANTYSNPPVGYFDYDFSSPNGTEIRVHKQVANDAAMAVLPQMYSGYDAFLAAKVVTNDLTYIPSAFEMVAMDVNLDTKVSAGDISQINQRSVKVIDEFNEQDGTASPDWRFVNEDVPNEELSWRISETYPDDDGLGFSKVRVPSVPGTYDLAAQILNPEECPVIVDDNNTFLGIATGDVDGSWKDADIGSGLKAGGAEMVVFDLANMYVEESFVNIPVKVRSEDVVNSLNFVIGYDQEISFENIVSHTNHIEYVYNTEDNYVGLTSYSLAEYDVDEPLFTVRFYAPNGFDASQLEEAYGWINGISTDVVKTATGVEPAELSVGVYPNPAADYLHVNVAEEVSITIVDMHGKVLFNKANVVEKERIDVSDFSNGIYLLKVEGANSAIVKRIAVQK